MKVKISSILIISILVLQGCVHTVKLAAVASPEQQIGYKQTVTSQKKHFVSLAPYREQNPASGRTSFILFVKNCGEEPINIDINNVSVIFEGNTKEWASRKITVLSSNDLMNELNARIGGAESAARMGVKTYYYPIYDTYGNLTGTYAQNETTPLYGLAMNELYQLNVQRMLVKELVMKSQTLQLEQSGGGLVVCNTRAMDDKTEGNFQVVVSLAGEEHKFTFNRSLLSSK